LTLIPKTNNTPVESPGMVFYRTKTHRLPWPLPFSLKKSVEVCCSPFMLRLAQHERTTAHCPLGEPSKSRPPFDRLRANGIWKAQLIFLGSGVLTRHSIILSLYHVFASNRRCCFVYSNHKNAFYNLTKMPCLFL